MAILANIILPLAKLSTGQCYLYYSCAVCTVLLIKYKIINLVHNSDHLPKLKFSSFMRDKQGIKIIKKPLLATNTYLHFQMVTSIQSEKVLTLHCSLLLMEILAELLGWMEHVVEKLLV
jgi:hypothetical protein